MPVAMLAMLTSFVIVVAGSPHDAMTRSIALDFERRGFIVFVTTASVSEERLIKNENREDLLPLTIDLTAVSLSLILHSEFFISNIYTDR